MNFGEVIFNFPCNIRYLEKLEKKLVKANIAILFNRTCINDNIYLYIYIRPMRHLASGNKCQISFTV